MTRSQLSRRTVLVDPQQRGLPEITIKTLERKEGQQPRMATMELLAAALDVPPETFIEYRLARARYALDEREVGLEAAMKELARIAR